MKTKNAFFALLFVLFITQISYSQYSKNEWKERDSWMNVSKILDFAEVRDGSLVGDVGCHEGYLSFHLSHRVGSSGKVYSVDIEEDRLETLKENIKSGGISNIDVILGDFDDPKLPIAKLDAVFVIDTYHEIDEYKKVLEHIMNSLKPGGHLLILEKLKNYAKDKTRKEQMDSHTLSPMFVKKEIEEAGFLVIKEIDNFGKWENDSDKIMWILLAIKKVE